jgi:p-hydroxybenzoate 3-monooxygenase
MDQRAAGLAWSDTGRAVASLKILALADKMVLRFRSFVSEPMRYGNLLLAGDAAHTVPPTGAKGLNLALADVSILADVLERAVLKKDVAALDQYSPHALARVWNRSISPTG